MSSVAVIGGGITGLAAARGLGGASADVHVTLLEREPRLGGKILTEHADGITYEAGPDAFVARDPAIMQLCSDLGLGEDLIPPAVFGAHIWSGGKLKELPAGWAFGLPASTGALLSSRLLPLDTKIRALWDLAAPGKLTGDDISIGDLVRRRFGGQILERVVDPVFAGSRAGTVDDISLAAASPPLDAVARSASSITRGLGKARREGKVPQGPPPFLGLAGGMQGLVERINNSMSGVTVMTGTAAERVETSGRDYQVHLDNGSTLDADAVVIATPAFDAAGLLESVDPETARQLYRIQYASSAVAVLVYEGSHDKIPKTGSGFLVPSKDHKVLSACTWFSKKWPTAVPGDDRLVLRCFVGRSGREASLALDDASLLSLIDVEVRDALKLTVALQTSRLYRWDRGLPHYRVGHLQLIEKIDAALAAAPGIALAGAAYRGSGLPDCVRQGEAAAARILNFLTSPGG
jgi:protoporphyrinogen/coproporphyrinogen III oxidase